MSASAETHQNKSNVLQSYDLSTVVRITGFTRTQIRTLVKKSIVKPEKVNQKLRFSYNDVKIIRDIKSLAHLGVSKQQILSSFQLVRDKIDSNKPLSTAFFRVIDGKIYFHDGKFLYNLQSNQTLLDLEGSATAKENSPRTSMSKKILQFDQQLAVTAVGRSDNWYNNGVALEDSEPEEAIACYKKELEINPHNYDAMLNLGRLYQIVREDLITARACYEAVLLHEPTDDLANFNLGTVWDILQKPKRAIDYYDKATHIPDSYYNKGRILEQLGREEEAAEQFRIYHLVKESLDKSDD